MLERALCMCEVAGSMPAPSINFRYHYKTLALSTYVGFHEGCRQFIYKVFTRKYVETKKNYLQFMRRIFSFLFCDIIIGRNHIKYRIVLQRSSAEFVPRNGNWYCLMNFATDRIFIHTKLYLNHASCNRWEAVFHEGREITYLQEVNYLQEIQNITTKKYKWF